MSLAFACCFLGKCTLTVKLSCFAHKFIHWISLFDARDVLKKDPEAIAKLLRASVYGNGKNHTSITKPIFKFRRVALMETGLNEIS